MGHEAVPRAYTGIRRSTGVAHSPLRADRWTGVLHLEWSFDRERPLVVGAGWYSLVGGTSVPDRRPNLGPRRMKPLRQEPEEVVAEIVRQGSDGPPVLPGSSIKGAVRQVYEMLTESCQPASRQACQVRPRDRDPQICPACSLFGAAGLGGRLAFGEGRLTTTQWKPQTARRRTPVAWPPVRWQEGTIRVYNQRRATERDGKTAAERELTWVAWGKFESTARLVNASDEEMGLLFAALGVSAASPMVRVGGKKFHGFGGAGVKLLGATRVHPDRKELQAGEIVAWASGLVERFVSRIPERKTAWKALHQNLAGTA